MLKKMAWNTFKNTGNINTMMELLEVNNIEKEFIEPIKCENNIEKVNNKNFIEKNNKNNTQV